MAKKLEMFIQEKCPYCIRARGYIKDVLREHPEYGDVEIEMTDELIDPQKADQYDYWYVPTFFMDGRKLHEGAATKEDIENVLKQAHAS